MKAQLLTEETGPWQPRADDPRPPPGHGQLLVDIKSCGFRIC